MTFILIVKGFSQYKGDCFNTEEFYTIAGKCYIIYTFCNVLIMYCSMPELTFANPC